MIGQRKKDRERIKELEEKVSRLESNMYISVYSSEFPIWPRSGGIHLSRAVELILNYLGLKLTHFEERDELREVEKENASNCNDQ